MLQEFATWWTAQIRALFSDMMTRAGGRAGHAPDALLAVVGEDSAMQLSLRRAGRIMPVGRYQIDAAGLAAARRAVVGNKRPVVVVLPGGSLLQQDAVLPLAAERDPATVLRYEMDRLTPFTAAEIAWSWRVVRRDPANNRLLVKLSLVPRVELAGPLEALGRIGLRPARLEAGGMALELHAPGRAQGRFALRALAVCCAVLAAAACVTPLVQQQRALGQADDAVDALRPRMALVNGLRSRLAARSNAEELLQSETARAGNALLALAAITRALPDDTYLTNFALKDRQVTLTGRSAAAARLIGDLSALPELRNPAFAAPVMRLGGDRLDQFSIHVELTP